ncbi:hypothetical protein BV140_1197 [Haemophilus influenzae]|nr:hypothetical protein BV083_1139 [Haemophilus influenzae]AVI97951.1 hypothetical protein BV085_1137 [Haemophilus influenzae]AVJ08803.1 hypothetical protein BV140_1197 [Haemophilus influenzae]
MYDCILFFLFFTSKVRLVFCIFPLFAKKGDWINDVYDS